MFCNDTSARMTASNALSTAHFAQGTADRAFKKASDTNQLMNQLRQRIEVLKKKIQG
ncbi:hypothetical protein [Xenorhabdus stockiae]|uniref:hypothetical protein n=1 Tax=Xenorhabdus stockiae TaxID=351614 RepID=UPI004063EEB1